MADQLSNDLASLTIKRDDAPPGNRSRWVVILAVLAVLGLVGAVAAWTLGNHVFKTEVRATEIQLVSPSQGSVDLTSTGYVVAQITSKVAAKIAGRIASVSVREGDRVKAGQVLVKLDDAEQRIAATAARARMETARATLADLRTQLAREKRLLAGGASAPATVEDLEARVTTQESATKAAEADSEAAQLALGYATITAPINGTVVTKPLETGEFVGPGTAEVVEISDFSSLLVETDVPEARLSRVKPHGPAEIVLDAWPDRRFRGEVVEVSPRINRAKATVIVKVKFVDAAEGVLPEMAARVSFLAAALDATAMKEPAKLMVPEKAVAERGGAKVVFRIDGDRVRMTPVTLGPKFASGFELVSGPPGGTRVVLEPPPALGDGMPVKERND